MSDLAEYDFFATQFANSLLKATENGDTNWFGRLTRYHQNQEFQLINFFGTNYTEDDLIKALRNNSIIIKTFDVSGINYTPDLNDPFYATVSADVHIDANIDGIDQSGDFTITHKIKQAWQTYESELLPV